jgi:hypothetical protein
MTRPPPPRFSPYDGLARSQDEDDALNEIALAVLGTGAGAQLLDYLRSITAGLALGPAATDAELRHLEGQRALVGNIMQRIDHARRHRGPAGKR